MAIEFSAMALGGGWIAESLLLLVVGAVRARPALFRALGDREPPERIEVGGSCYERLRVFKHDSFASTVLYTGEERWLICKFNRCQPVFGLPVGWLGRFLAWRETRLMERMAGVKGFAHSPGPVHVEGEVVPYAAAHAYIPGHPLGADEQVDDLFFPRLRERLRQLHERQAAHVDLNKRENILVGEEDGEPYLIDYQIHFALPRRGLGNNWLTRRLLKVLQKSDRYHLMKHQIRLRPDQLAEGERDVNRIRPWWIRGWRCVATPLRQGRRRLLVAVGIRSAGGQASTEQAPEQAFDPQEKA